MTGQALEALGKSLKLPIPLKAGASSDARFRDTLLAMGAGRWPQRHLGLGPKPVAAHEPVHRPGGRHGQSAPRTRAASWFLASSKGKRGANCRRAPRSRKAWGLLENRGAATETSPHPRYPFLTWLRHQRRRRAVERTSVPNNPASRSSKFDGQGQRSGGEQPGRLRAPAAIEGQETRSTGCRPGEDDGWQRGTPEARRGAWSAARAHQATPRSLLATDSERSVRNPAQPDTWRSDSDAPAPHLRGRRMSLWR